MYAQAASKAPCVSLVRHRRCTGASTSKRLRVRAVKGEYNAGVPNLDFVNEVLKVFPEEGVANVDEARALYDHGGYTMLDIRTSDEVNRFGQIPTARRAREGGVSVRVPFKNVKKRFEDGKQQIETSDNPDFLDQVAAKFSKDTKLLILDFDGQAAIDALEALYEKGFDQIVGIQGGYKMWFKTWDNKLKRRNLGEYQEHSWGEGRDSLGIHASGAGFENGDAQSKDFWSSF